MPYVDGKKFSYSKKGKAQARAAILKKLRRVKGRATGGYESMPAKRKYPTRRGRFGRTFTMRGAVRKHPYDYKD